MTEIVPNLYVGNQDDARYFDGSILCVSDVKPFQEPPRAIWLPILSDGRADQHQLDASTAIIAGALRSGQPILVHCGAGIERSPLAVAWYLARHGMSLDDAYKLLRSKRPEVQDRRGWL